MPSLMPTPEDSLVMEYCKKMYNSDIDEDALQKYRLNKCLGHPFSHWTVHRHFIKPKDSTIPIARAPIAAAKEIKRKSMIAFFLVRGVVTWKVKFSIIRSVFGALT